MKCFHQLWGFMCSKPTLGVCACIPVALGTQGTRWHPEPSPGPLRLLHSQCSCWALLVPAQQCHYTAHYLTLFFSLSTLPKQAEKLQATVWFSEGILKFNLKLMYHYFGCNLVRHQPASGTTQPSASWSGFFSVRCLNSSTARFSLYKNIQTKKFFLPALSFWTNQMAENKQTSR